MNVENIGFGSFNEIYNAYLGKVSSIVRGFRFHDGAADDIIQDTFVQAWERLDTLKDPKAFGGWLITIARNKCLNEIRKQKATVPVSGLDLIYDDETESSDIAITYDNAANSMKFEYSIQLLTELIESHQVEPRASIAKLFYLERMPVKEISKSLNINQNTVLSHLRRFRLIVSKAMVRLVDEKGIEIDF